MINEVTMQDFEAEVLNSDMPVLVDFNAPVCVCCEKISPFLNEIDRESSDTVRIVSVNIDNDPELAVRYKVMSIPTLIMFRKGEETGRTVGYNTKEQILALINS